MLINTKVLNIPPYISVLWNQIEFLTTEEKLLVINMKSGKTVKIPDLSEETIQRAFQMHSSYADIERAANIMPIPPLPQHSPFGGSGLKIAFSTMDPNGLGLPLQHMEELRDAPDIPKEVLEKVKAISKLVSPEDLANSPKPVEECNCPFCQIASAIHSDFMRSSDEITVEIIEEEVNDEELKFEEWAISQKGDKLFEVQNKLDSNESYTVFLGEPVGCTCGKCGCEHILAVLKS